MPKLTGIGMTFSIDDGNGASQNITNDITSLTFNTPRGSQDVTGLDKSSMERLLLLGDGQVQITGVVNDATNGSFDVIKSAGTYDSARTVDIARNGHTLQMEMIMTECSYNRAQSGEWTFNATLQLADGSDPTWS